MLNFSTITYSRIPHIRPQHNQHCELWIIPAKISSQLGTYIENSVQRNSWHLLRIYKLWAQFIVADKTAVLDAITVYSFLSPYFAAWRKLQRRSIFFVFRPRHGLVRVRYERFHYNNILEDCCKKFKNYISQELVNTKNVCVIFGL